MDDADREKMKKLNAITGELTLGMSDAYMQARQQLDMVHKIKLPDPTPEVVGAWCSTGSISARDIVFPKKYGGGGGGGSDNGSGGGGKIDWEAREKVSVDEREYTGGFWDYPAEEKGGMGSLSRLRVVNNRVLEHYTGKGVDPDAAVEARLKFFGGWYESKFGKELPEIYAHKDSPLTKGESSYLMDKAEEQFPGLMDKGKRGA